MRLPQKPHFGMNAAGPIGLGDENLALLAFAVKSQPQSQRWALGGLMSLQCGHCIGASPREYYIRSVEHRG
jgi:hypothetical protein